jgi:hypothetical protein
MAGRNVHDLAFREAKKPQAGPSVPVGDLFRLDNRTVVSTCCPRTSLCQELPLTHHTSSNWSFRISWGGGRSGHLAERRRRCCSGPEVMPTSS